MNTDRPPPSIPPVTEADLHAFVDGRLPAERQVEIAAYLAARPEDAQRLEAYRAHKRELHALFDPVLDEQPPQRLLKSARPRAVPQTPTPGSMAKSSPIMVMRVRALGPSPIRLARVHGL